eukprot:CAMPEP_0115058454 /NCGR_PEP_ID=MMETSP0227-20121206/6353_1 /TAXON_ID=89957 /ORGANISM="Polarella glacialis, Strain CCMP 1383" /LENGTH=52 /DNA_ID=CAMNT_0002443431 /DNA_START=61 /DNA_END=219 /DNA_ORIENTATION=+
MAGFRDQNRMLKLSSPLAGLSSKCPAIGVNLPARVVVLNENGLDRERHTRFH